MDGKNVAVVCSRGTPEPKPKRCAICGRDGTRLCDYPRRDSGTCDVPLCDDCTTPRLGLGSMKASEWDHFDLCPEHAAKSAQLGFGDK